jgi:hypothetical protein
MDDDLLSVICDYQVGESISLGLGNTGSASSLSETVSRKRVYNRVEDGFEPTELENSQDVRSGHRSQL